MVQILQNCFYTKDQFSVMADANFKQPVVVDSDVIVQEIQQGRTLKPIAKRIKKHKSRMVIPESVLGKVQKITGSEPRTIMEKIYQYHRYPMAMDKTKEICSESEKFSKKYEKYHTSQSLVLATAKVTGSALVSLDKDFVETAKLEGIKAFIPRNFIRWW